MSKQDPEEEQSISETLELTAKLEKNLRKLMSSRKYNQQKTIVEERRGSEDDETVIALHKQIKKLKEENKQLHVDNQQICRDLLRSREENRQIKKQLTQCKKYVTHLQGYNQELKKQLLFWMRKPTKAQGNRQKEEEEGSVGELMTQVLKLRRQNQARQHQLLSIKNTLQVKQIKIPNSSSKTIFLPIRSHQKLSKKQKQSKSKLNNKTINECTSCNYQDYSGTKPKKTLSKGPTIYTHKRKISKNLCECHRNYVQTSQFIH